MNNTKHVDISTTKIKDIDFKKVERQPEGNYQVAHHGDFGSFTVLDRETGYSFGGDTETGFRDKQGRLWIVAGMFDIRRHPELTIEEAIELIKEEANVCRG